MVRAEPGTLFVFGDNMHHAGLGGQAKEMRGERNTVGIPTKWRPSTKEGSFFADDDLDRVRAEIDEAFGRLIMHIATGGGVVWPIDGIGTGLAELPKRAPLIWEYIETGRKALEKLAAGSSLPPPQESTGLVLASPGAGSVDFPKDGDM